MSNLHQPKLLLDIPQSGAVGVTPEKQVIPLTGASAQLAPSYTTRYLLGFKEVNVVRLNGSYLH